MQRWMHMDITDKKYKLSEPVQAFSEKPEFLSEDECQSSAVPEGISGRGSTTRLCKWLNCLPVC